MALAIPINWCETKDEHGEYCKNAPTHVARKSNDVPGYFVCQHHADVFAEAKWIVYKVDNK